MFCFNSNKIGTNCMKVVFFTSKTTSQVSPLDGYRSSSLMILFTFIGVTISDVYIIIFICGMPSCSLPIMVLVNVPKPTELFIASLGDG
jgi:hypothetical protein